MEEAFDIRIRAARFHLAMGGEYYISRDVF
jgi:hypothetical protein